MVDNGTATCGAGDAICVLPGSVPECDSCLPCGGNYWLQHKETVQLKDEPAANPCTTLPCVHPGEKKNTHGDYRLVMGTACAWLVWTVILWFVAYRKLKQNTPANAAGGVRVGRIQDESREGLIAAAERS